MCYANAKKRLKSAYETQFSTNVWKGQVPWTYTCNTSQEQRDIILFELDVALLGGVPPAEALTKKRLA